jgi:hypothetical protein
VHPSPNPRQAFPGPPFAITCLTLWTPWIVAMARGDVELQDSTANDDDASSSKDERESSTKDVKVSSKKKDALDRRVE